jgi:hypothetical protein
VKAENNTVSSNIIGKKAGTLKKFTGLHAAFTGRNPHVRFGEGEGSLAVHNERVERRKRDIRDILD